MIFDNAAPTGWSKKTVNCKLFVTGVQFTKNGKTQPFLEMVHREVLIFWCLKSVRWTKSCLSRFYRNGGLAPYWLQHTWRKESPVVCQCLFVPDATMKMNWGFLGLSLGIQTCFNEFQGLRGAHGCVWGLIPCSIQSDWRRTNQFSTTSKGKIVFSWRFIDIKISKPPLVSFPKMVGFYHFLWFWHLSQRNYNWQSFWITL